MEETRKNVVSEIGSHKTERARHQPASVTDRQFDNEKATNQSSDRRLQKVNAAKRK